MTSRRSFVKQASLATILTQWSSCPGAMPLVNAETNQVDWEEVRNLFPIVKWDNIHFNSGSAGVLPTPVINYLNELTLALSSKAPYVVWSEWEDENSSNERRVAQLVNVSEEEIQFVRNTTEALNLIISGIPLNTGDEILISEHAYPYALNAWKNRVDREGLQLSTLEYALPDNDDSIIANYENAITPRTKVIHLTHITHRQGHITPVKAITELAHDRGIEVVIDGAHVVGQIAVDLADIGCDYFASSLHKWLNAPHGCGLLYVKADKLKNIFPILSSPVDAAGIGQFEHLGTRAWQVEIGLSAALDFHDHLGHAIKYNRLQKLKHYWTDQLQDVPNLQWWTNLDDSHSCSVVTIGIDGKGARAIKKSLSQEFNIHAKAVGGSWGSGVRISPNIFTNYNDLDLLVAAIKAIASRD